MFNTVAANHDANYIDYRRYIIRVIKLINKQITTLFACGGTSFVEAELLEPF